MIRQQVLELYMIQVMKPKLASFQMASYYLRQIDSNRIYSNYGSLVRELESRYGLLFGVSPNRVVALANATLAIQGCAQNSQVEEWAVPNFTFAATALAIQQSGKKMRILEVNPVDWKIDRELIDSDGVGIIPVMPFGAPTLVKDYLNWEIGRAHV